MIQETEGLRMELPVQLEKRLNRFCEQLSAALGDSLASVVLYGGLAKGDEYHPRSSDVNLMVVLDEISVSRLDTIAGLIRKARRTSRFAPMVLAERNLQRSADVFPIKFLDIQHHHRVLWGRDTLAELAIDSEYVRLRCLQELQNLLLRLRDFYLRRSDRPKLVRETLESVISPFLHSLNALLFLKTGQAPLMKAATIRAAETELDLNAEVLEQIFALKRGGGRMSAAKLRQLFDDLMVTAERAADLADELGKS